MDQADVSYDNFKDLISSRVGPLLDIVNCLSDKKPGCKCFNRFVLKSLLAESTQVEEFLDFYGAKNNCRWAPFRSLIATIKLFSEVCYELLHIQHSVPIYRLLPIGFQFTEATQKSFVFSANVIVRAAPLLIEKARQLGLEVGDDWHTQCVNFKAYEGGRLPQDRGACHIDSAAKTVINLATAFLNLSVKGDMLHVLTRTEPDEYESCIIHISEKDLRSLQLEFHNLQSLYDTFVSDTDVESLDTNLPVLRGHISVVFHLLKTATALVHYYERHLVREPSAIQCKKQPLVEKKEMLDILIGYSVCFASRYIVRAKELCREMLQSYAEIDKIDVPVPQYRGFHVRPSTLISKIVLHYGNNVTMQLCDETYDASSPMDLFRANEKINAIKRKNINKEIACSAMIPNAPGIHRINEVLMDVIMELASKKKLMLYEQPLTLREGFENNERTLFDQIVEEIARLQAMGKIDVDISLTATFTGDKRVLEDIKVLADCGYGEDSFGNNILLPDKLVYLRRQR